MDPETQLVRRPLAQPLRMGQERRLRLDHFELQRASEDDIGHREALAQQPRACPPMA
jgi:hypothetical protein